MTGQPNLSQSSLFERLRPLLASEAQPVYVVGGTVRDAVLGRPIHDIDLVVASEAIQLTFRLARALDLPAFVLDGDRDVGRIIAENDGLTIDIARFRGPTLEDDLAGRDFTINALAFPIDGDLSNDIIDKHKGLDDLRLRRIRTIHSRSIADDPIRALRAIRFSTQLGFSMTRETAELVRAAGKSLPSQASAERIRDELSRILTSGAPHQGFHSLHDLEILAAVLPDIAALDAVAQSPPHHEDVFRHTLSVLRYLAIIDQILGGQSIATGWNEDVASLLGAYRGELLAHLDQTTDGGTSGRLLLMWGGLLHDVGKRATQTVEPDGRIRFFGHDEAGAEIAGRLLSAFSFSNEAARRVRAIVAGHMRPLHLATDSKVPSRRATFRYYQALREGGLDVGLLALADHLATYDGIGDERSWSSLLVVVNTLYDTYFRDHERTIAPPRLLDGQAIMAELAVPPGHEIGRLLRLLQEAQAAGEINTKAEAIAFIRANRSA